MEQKEVLCTPYLSRGVPQVPNEANEGCGDLILTIAQRDCNDPTREARRWRGS